MKNLDIVDWSYFSFLAVAFILSLHQGWENFVNKRISRYSVDRWMLFLSEKFASKEHHSHTKELAKDPKRLLVLGIYAVIVFVKSSQQIYVWISENF